MPLASHIERLKRRLFRWQDDGSGHFRLDRRRIFILPTRHGLLYAVALMVMLLGAINYTLALGHALVFLLAGLGLTGMVHTFRNLHQLGISPGRCPPVFCGESAHFELLLDNDRASSRFALNFQAGDDASQASLGPRASAPVRIALPTTRRGWLALPRTRVRTRYPLGLFTAWSDIQPRMRCLVYPRPAASPLPPPIPISGAGDEGHGLGQEDFSGFRERQAADPLHHVAWKASARGNENAPLLIKQFSGNAQYEICLDWSLTDPVLPDESRLSILTGWVLAAEAAGVPYRMRLPELEIPRGLGTHHRDRCLEALALAKP